MINFNDTKAVFAHKSNFELRKSYYLFSILQHSLLVKIGSLLLKISFFLRLPVKKLIKMTIFNQFCGGENIKDCTRKINKLSEFRIGTILDYSVEEKENENLAEGKLEIDDPIDIEKKENEEIKIIQKYMPLQIDDSKINSILDEAIKETDSVQIRDMGKVMSFLKDNYSGQMDFGKVSGMLKDKLKS